MRILFDHGTPSPLRSFLSGHSVATTQNHGWETLNNGELLRADKNIRYQQNLTERVIAIVVLGNSRWPVVKLYVDRIIVAINGAKRGTYYEVNIPQR
jgi:hypothetical protein